MSYYFFVLKKKLVLHIGQPQVDWSVTRMRFAYQISFNPSIYTFPSGFFYISFNLTNEINKKLKGFLSLFHPPILFMRLPPAAS